MNCLCVQSVDNATDSLDVSVKTVLEVIGLADLNDELSVSSQLETCTCEGGYCNGATGKSRKKMESFALTLCLMSFLMR